MLWMDQFKGLRDQLEAENMADCEVTVSPITRGKNLATFLREGGEECGHSVLGGHMRTRASTDSLS